MASDRALPRAPQGVVLARRRVGERGIGKGAVRKWEPRHHDVHQCSGGMVTVTTSTVTRPRPAVNPSPVVIESAKFVGIIGASDFCGVSADR